MKISLHIAGIGSVNLTDKNYVGGGGEADVYTKDNIAYKIYHDHKKMIPIAKIEELKKLTSKNVLVPQNVIYNKKKTEIGYTMPFKKETIPLCKLFTKSFKNNNGIKEEDIVKLVTSIQKTISKVHNDGFLIVDLNEMNILVSSSFKTPYFIDVDSYQTPGFTATAIMDSIRDRKIKNNNFTELSDWFSFAIIAFQLYIGIHPYKGKHPNYKPNEWTKRMDDGISVLNSKVKLPNICNDFSVIPENHKKWFESIFVKNERSIPPMPNEVMIISASKPCIKNTESFDVEQIANYPSNIISILHFMGANYVITRDKIYKDQKELPNDVKNYTTLICESTDISPVICKFKNNEIIFEDINTFKIDKSNATNMMYKNGAIYSLYDGKIFEHVFDKFSNKIIHKTKIACNAMENATRFFDGVIFQNLIGKWHITLPYEQRKCLFAPVKELNGCRILEAKSEGHVCGVLAEKKGCYYRFVLTFDKNFSNYEIEIIENVNYGPINFTVLNNGVVIFVSDGEVKLSIKSV